MKKRWLIAVIAAYIIARIYIATLSSYGFYHGWNEGWYSLIAKNYFSGSLWEQIAYTGGGPFSSAPPFFFVCSICILHFHSLEHPLVWQGAN